MLSYSHSSMHSKSKWNYENMKMSVIFEKDLLISTYADIKFLVFLALRAFYNMFVQCTYFVRVDVFQFNILKSSGSSKTMPKTPLTQFYGKYEIQHEKSFWIRCLNGFHECATCWKRQSPTCWRLKSSARIKSSKWKKNTEKDHYVSGWWKVNGCMSMLWAMDFIANRKQVAFGMLKLYRCFKFRFDVQAFSSTWRWYGQMFLFVKQKYFPMFSLYTN